MSERVVEILIYIMSEIRRNRSASKKLDLLSQNLIKQGYTESEISSAFTWLLDRIDSETEELLPKQNQGLNHSFRHLHEIERSIISPQAYGYIIQLKELGIIDDIDFEQILERALMLGTAQVGISEIKPIVSSLLTSSESLMNGTYFVFDDNQIIH
jgi:uncharacterized protein Smg (DUF494 family)